MLGIIYTQSFENLENYLLEIDLSQGEYQQIVCVECHGTGVYWITETDSQKCNHCKANGKIWFNAY